MKNIIYILFFLIVYSANSQCWKEISATNSVTYAINDDGTLWAWGWNTLGLVGDGTTIDRYFPVQIGVENDWKNLSFGNGAIFFIKENGTLWGMGWNQFGEVGIGTLTIANTPIQIGMDNDWKEVYTTNASTFAIKENGSLWAWGLNMNKELGDGTIINRNSPVFISNNGNWKQIKGFLGKTIGLKNDGTLWYWGVIDCNNSTNTSAVPIQIGTDNNWLKLNNSGGQHIIAIKNDGTLWGWGLNQYGETGNTVINNCYNIPIQIGTDSDWFEVAVGNNFTIAQKNNGSLWGFGRNNVGQLGKPYTQNNVNTLEQIGNLSNWKRVTCNTNTTYVIDNSSSLFSFGFNAGGELGSNSMLSYNYLMSEIICSSLNTVNHINNMNYIVYPNPAKYFLKIQNNENQIINKIEIFDMIGKKVLEQNYDANINVQNFQKGIYIIRILSNGEIYQEKFIKE